jgi:hypothetical protein
VFSALPSRDSVVSGSTSSTSHPSTSTASRSSSTLLASTSTPLFDQKGVLASGKQKLLLFFANASIGAGNGDQVATVSRNTYASFGDSFMGPGLLLYQEE